MANGDWSGPIARTTTSWPKGMSLPRRLRSRIVVTPWQPVGRRVLQQGVDFDQVAGHTDRHAPNAVRRCHSASGGRQRVAQHGRLDQDVGEPAGADLAESAHPELG
jgi:hypothetical protein